MSAAEPPEGTSADGISADTTSAGGTGFATSRIVTGVFDEILAAIHQGRLLPGQRISDSQLAERLGVSRTPVREALQRLREIGIIEASANRFTRVAEVSPRQTAEALVVWAALYGALVDEVVPDAPPAVFEAMDADHRAFREQAAALNMQGIATSNFLFFDRLVALSRNALLRKQINSVAHVIRLGSLHLPGYIDFAALDHSQAMLLDAVKRHDLTGAHEAMTALREIEIPQS